MTAPDANTAATRGRRKSRLLAATLAAVAVLVSAPSAAAAQPGETAAELRVLEAQGIRDIIVRREPGTSSAERADSRADVAGSLVAPGPLPGTEVLRVPAGTLDEAVAELRDRPGIRWAEADGRVRAATPDPTYQWSLVNDGRTLSSRSGELPGRADADADVPEAWTRSTGTGVTVAVVDSGVDAAHPDLAGRVAGNPGEQGDGRESNGRDDDNNGFIDDATGWDWVDADAIPADAHGHGTHVTGTVAAVRGNGIGIAGVAPDAQVLALRVLDASGGGWDSDVAAAFDYAGRLGIPVVNASLGGFGHSPAEEDAIRRHPGTLFVVASGNAGADVDASAHSPCTLPLPNLICVGASDHADQPAGYSNYGATQVDLFAPGSLITSLAPGGGYTRMTGTSMAAPHVAGVVALAKALTPGAAGADLRQAVLDGADRVSGLSGRSATGGRLNAAATLDRSSGPAPRGYEPAPLPEPAPAPVPTATPGTTAPAVPPQSQPASPFERLAVAVRGRRVTARVVVSRSARVRMTVRRGRATTASARRLGSGATTLRLGHLRPGRYVLELTAGSARVSRPFTVR